MLMIYGAAGYTARLVARELDHRGLPVILAGRDAAALRASRLRGELRAFALAHGFTARTAAAIIARVLAGATANGFATPSRILHWDALLALDGVAEVAA